jgi:hypothetical protein
MIESIREITPPAPARYSADSISIVFVLKV